MIVRKRTRIEYLHLHAREWSRYHGYDPARDKFLTRRYMQMILDHW